MAEIKPEILDNWIQKEPVIKVNKTLLDFSYHPENQEITKKIIHQSLIISHGPAPFGALGQGFLNQNLLWEYWHGT